MRYVTTLVSVLTAFVLVSCQSGPSTAPTATNAPIGTRAARPVPAETPTPVPTAPPVPAATPSPTPAAIPTPTPTPEPLPVASLLFQDVLDEMAGVQSYRLKGQLAVRPEQQGASPLFEARVEGMAGSGGDSQLLMRIKVRVQGLSVEGEMEMREVDGVAYLRDPRTGTWTLDEEGGRKGGRQSLMGLSDILENETGLQDARVRLDTLGGSVVYRLTGLLEDQGQVHTVDLWVDRQSHTVLRMRREGPTGKDMGFLPAGSELGNLRVSVDLTFEGFNEPVVVEKPEVAARPPSRAVGNGGGTGAGLRPGEAAWSGKGRGQTAVFELPAGEWEYCAQILALSDPHSGLRVSLYTEQGLWVSSDSGYGSVGSLGCTRIPAGATGLSLRIFASDDTRWAAGVRMASPSNPVIVELPRWDQAPGAIPPERVDAGRLTYASTKMDVTDLFAVRNSSWAFCWELYPVPPEGSISTPFLRFSALFEDEGQVGEWSIPQEKLQAGQSGCIDVRGRQPGRYRLLVADGMTGLGWRIVVPGATYPRQ